jgi:hypothetical protein
MGHFLSPGCGTGEVVVRSRSKIPNKGIEMIREQQPAISLFSTGMVGLGALSAIYRDFALTGSPSRHFIPDEMCWQ